MPKSLLQQILCGITCSLTVGVYCLTRAIMAVEKSFCIKGVRDGGGVAFEKRI
jgi:hypothetical protein